MSNIERITRLRHPGVLRDFSWPTDLPSFSRFNLIYGWNGTGKTTVSRVLRAIEQRVVPPTGQVTLRIDGYEVSQDDFPLSGLPIRVFNRDFINESVFPTSGGNVPPILVVGKENVEKQKKLDHLKALRSEKEDALQQARAALQQASKELDRHCSERAKVIKDTLRVSGPARYNEYDKSDYRERAQHMAAAGDSASHRLIDTDRDSLLIQHRGNLKPKLERVSYRLPLLPQLHTEVAAALASTITSAAIESLSHDPARSEWVRNGLNLHRERTAETCLFCEQPLPVGRLLVLQSHFNEEYDRFLERFDTQIGDLKQLSKQASDLQFPDRMALYENLTAEYESLRAAIQTMLGKVSRFLTVLVQVLTEKRSKPFKSIEFGLAVPEVDDGDIARLNDVIARHNETCDDFEAKTEDSRDRLALDLIAQNLDDYSRLSAAAKAASDAIGPLERVVQQCEVEMTRLEREIVEHRQPAEELNEDLRKYLGHDEFRLQVKETGYQLFRNGQLAEALSEGERTALALLYFLKSLRDRRFDLSRGVVVLDDPVSSLDANALFLAFGFIRERTKDAGQLILLTHNFALFRQVRNWFHHLKGQNRKDIDQRPARFYMLDLVHGTSPRRTALMILDPLLERYESEYHFLFACVYRSARAGKCALLAETYGLPNIARRLLEMFLAFRRPQIAGELWQKLGDVAFDEAKKIRICRFIHTHSHGDTVGEPEHDLSQLAEARAVLNDLLDLMKTEDPKHFAAMEGIVTCTGEGADSE